MSDAEWDDLPRQIEDAMRFLDRHGDALRALCTSHEVTDATLDFPVYSRIDDHVINQNHPLPRGLVARCGALGLGIELAVYARNVEQVLADARDRRADAPGQPAADRGAKGRDGSLALRSKP